MSHVVWEEIHQAVGGQGRPYRDKTGDLDTPALVKR